MQGVERYKVTLLPHDAMWEVEFSQVKKLIQSLWQDNVIDVQHFGSTAIQNVWAKPILDVAVVLKSFADMNIEALTAVGYDYCGVQKPDNDRHLFVLRGDGEISLHHIHCYEPNNPDFIHCIKFRDYLNSHPEKAEEYSELKKRLALQFPDDGIAYTEAKYTFIQEITLFGHCHQIFIWVRGLKFSESRPVRRLRGIYRFSLPVKAAKKA